MNRGTLPPQAYTRDQVTASYQWLQTQPEEVRRQATSADAMVALYLRAKRSGDTPFAESAPVSEKAFRENLRTIASELQNFDPKPMNEAVPLTRPIGMSTQNGSGGYIQSQPKIQNLEFKEVVQSITTTTATATNSDPTADIDLDPESWSRLTEVKQRLNLSHEREALRMLLVLGYERLQKMLS